MRGKGLLSHRLSWSGWFIFANGLLAALTGINYLQWIQIPDGSTALYVTLLFGSQFVALAAFAGIPLIAAALVLSLRLLAPLACLYATALLALLMLDTVVYAQYRFHLSGFVLELVTAARTEVFSFSWRTLTAAIGFILAVLIGEVLLTWALCRKRPSSRLLVPAFALVWSCQLVTHGWHAVADATYDHRITAVTRHVPLYYAATAKRFFEDNRVVSMAYARNENHSSNLDRLQLEQSSGQLAYPRKPLACVRPPTPPNLLIIAVDSLRADMLDARWMPRLSEFAETSALNFTNHRSNGNATKPGLFTLFYGVPASYWDSFSSAGIAPVLIERLQELNYDIRILSSSTLISPAFDRNIFSSIRGLRLHTPGRTSWQRDARISQDWLTFLNDWAGRPDRRPFFGFLFYDSPHSFTPPPEFPRVEPFWDPINLLDLNNEFDPQPYFNVYKTTVRYTDVLIGTVLQDLHQRDLLTDTLVIVTSDHGKEFNENKKNYWGHGSNFSDFQLRVPLVVHWPGKGSGRIDRETVHFDIAPTLLRKALGCESSDPEDFASGTGLFTDHRKKWTIAHSYMSHALIVGQTLIVADPTGNVDIMTKNLEPEPDYSAPAGLVSDVLQELARFNTR